MYHGLIFLAISALALVDIIFILSMRSFASPIIAMLACGLLIWAAGYSSRSRAALGLFFIYATLPTLIAPIIPTLIVPIIAILNLVAAQQLLLSRSMKDHFDTKRRNRNLEHEPDINEATKRKLAPITLKTINDFLTR